MYIVVLEYNPNCPVHDPSWYDSLRFYDNLQDVLKDSISLMRDSYTIKEVYHNKKNNKIEVDYHYSSHNYHGLTFKIKWLKLRTVDDGKGNLIWARL